MTGPSRASGAERPSLEVHGCSFAYGWSLEDSATFPWRMQRALPGWEVVNYGVGGHGTVHSYLRLEELEARRPALVVLTYGSLHDERNVLSRRFRKALGAYREQTAGLLAPVAVHDDGGLRVDYRHLGYERPPFATRSALVELLDEGYARWERSEAQERAISDALLAACVERVRAAGVPLVVAGIWRSARTREALETLAAAGVRTVDLSLDLSEPGLSLAPVDWHPSPLAQAHYAEALLDYLRSEGLLQR